MDGLLQCKQRSLRVGLHCVPTQIEHTIYDIVSNIFLIHIYRSWRVRINVTKQAKLELFLSEP